MTNKPEFVEFVGPRGPIFVNRNRVLIVVPKKDTPGSCVIFMGAGEGDDWEIKEPARDVVLRLQGMPVGEQKCLPA